MQIGYVALLDVLGFSGMVARDSQAEWLWDYHTLVNTVMQTQEPKGLVEYVVFSDTIVLTIDGQKENALLHLVTQCSRMLSYLLDHDIPIRGAIAHGQYLRVPSPNGVFVAGKAIIEAYKYEILQDWIGIILAPSIHNFGPDFFSLCEIPQLIGSGSRPPQANARWASCLQHCREIQFHASGSDGRSLYEGFAIVPFDGVLTGENMLASLQEKIRRLARLKIAAPDPPSQRKCAHTSKWLNEVHIRWSAFPGPPRQPL